VVAGACLSGRGDHPAGVTSALLLLNRRVQALQLDAYIVGGEAPVDAPSGGVAPVLPGPPLLLEGRCVGDPSVEALPPEDAQLDFRHVQPTPVLRGVVDLQLVG
jgi:hypothetical protein